MSLHLRVADLADRRPPPLRPLVLVDDHCPDAIVEIVAMDNARHDTKLGLHAVGKRPGLAASHLRKRDLQAGWGFSTNQRSRGPRESSLVAVGNRLAIKVRENIF